MRYHQVLGLASFLFLFVASGCDVVNTVDKDIKKFIESEPLPDTQAPVYLLRVPEHHLKVFRVPFGSPYDCPSGCAYSQVFGIKLGSRIGWMKAEIIGIDLLDRNDLHFFEVRSSDTYLFSRELRRKLQKVSTSDKRGWRAKDTYGEFLQMLARDTDTPSGTLHALAQLLYTEYHPAVALTLIDNPIVKNNRTILETLAELPSFNGSRMYEKVRKQARELLKQLNE